MRPEAKPPAGSAFIGRERELALLQQAGRSRASAFIPVYGRRRVGKSELILRLLAEHAGPGIYYVGKQGPAALQIAEFLRVAAEALGEPLLAEVSTESWRKALRLVVERRRGRHKLVLALDEFQWMAGASPELPSVLQELWDRSWKESGGLLLILCGSYVGFMEREVLGRQSPLFGRRTAQIHLQPFGFREARRFHPNYSLVDSARTYFVCGGVPQYLRAFEPSRSVEANIRACFLDEFAPLHREPDFLLREELREVQNYYAILMTLARGSASNATIAARTGLPVRSLPYYLGQLVELRYLRRRYPLTGKPPVTRHVRFVLDDPLLRFWFRFVYPHTSLIPRLSPAELFSRCIRPELPSHFGSCFEALCREALPLLYAEEGVEATCEVGEFWSKDLQLDLVGLRDDGWTDLGECRWGTLRSRKSVVAELRAKLERYPNPRNATLAPRVFARRAIKPAAAERLGVRWHGLAELYGED